jgi:hypothetical protein
MCNLIKATLLHTLPTWSMQAKLQVQKQSETKLKKVFLEKENSVPYYPSNLKHAKLRPQI